MSNCFWNCSSVNGFTTLVGAPAVPCVNVGDSVAKGDVIAKPAEGKLGACIHASISGTVKEIANNAITIA